MWFRLIEIKAAHQRCHTEDSLFCRMLLLSTNSNCSTNFIFSNVVDRVTVMPISDFISVRLCNVVFLKLKRNYFYIKEFKGYLKAIFISRILINKFITLKERYINYLILSVSQSFVLSFSLTKNADKTDIE